MNAPLNGLRVFISYPRGGWTQSQAHSAERHLRALGADVFLDTNSVREGDDNALNRIEAGLRRAQVVAFFAGPDTEESVWQQREARLAEFQHIPIVLVQTSTVPPPWYLGEKQPVNGTSSPEQWLPRLADALHSQARGAPRDASDVADPTAPAAGLRRLEVAYLAHHLAVAFVDRPGRYVALQAQARASASPLRSRKDLPFNVDLVLQRFQPAEQGAQTREPQVYADVLSAYAEILARPGPAGARLAVLGEPGAGKSFSLERLFCHLADAALADAQAPLPLFVALGEWTRADQRFDDFLETRLRPHGLDLHWQTLRDGGRAVLLLDGLNELPVSQRLHKSAQVLALAQDRRWAGVIVSCRERDFADPALRLPYDTLHLQPLTPLQVWNFLHRWAERDWPPERAAQEARARFWQLAAGPALADAAAQVWAAWQGAGASLAQFWQATEVPRDDPDVFSQTDIEQDELWRDLRDNPRSLLRLAASPYWLTLLAMLPEVPSARQRLVDGFLTIVHEQGARRCRARGAASEVPDVDRWRQALEDTALQLQGLETQGSTGALRLGAMRQIGRPAGPGSDARTHLVRLDRPSSLSDEALEFAIGVQVLKQVGEQIAFTHQLLQEALSATALADLALAGHLPASALWPPDRWWQRTGWEVVAEMAGESLAGHPDGALALVSWLARAQPEVASQAWIAAGRPTLPPDRAEQIRHTWFPRLTTEAEQAPEARLHARSAIGLALGRFSLDQRPGIGVRADGLPDIDWVRFADQQGFLYQGQRHPPLPAFELARYPVTQAQFQAFIDDGGYAVDTPWWNGLDQRLDAPAEAAWAEPNAPRVTVSWFEAVAYCRWLSHRLGEPIRLPTEKEWERAAAGTEGRNYPWGAEWDPNRVNAEERLGRTCAVGLFPEGARSDVHDLIGNVWEWCLNEFYDPERVEVVGKQSRALRGGSWFNSASYARASVRGDYRPGFRESDIGFRLCRASPI
ncbi:SUMF1/EgtB/PvdO family nonheme iron enzyme [Ideonella sp. 4Y11]|uniref:SUMF1/EgtB/PvdO family nonheme iron enzyme n=1 Tax=Ideonella aquatica TaxID=2824119 RepID=A0A940YET3_9BURK|nr:SUMF1/EgtB/PvdO family nonheme iron enzyme [Ideonella aquatica]MBQ0957437.1 SUMF1/EgtB/PvdO family nonheme iron enzyme [Ideonella aquatica]